MNCVEVKLLVQGAVQVSADWIKFKQANRITKNIAFYCANPGIVMLYNFLYTYICVNSFSDFVVHTSAMLSDFVVHTNAIVFAFSSSLKG